MRRTQTTTQTATVTNTHVGVAVALTLAIGGLAFAGVPAAKVNKCGVSSTATVKVLNCRSGMYSGANYTCFDGSKKQYRPGKCVSRVVLESYGKNVACNNRCTLPPQQKKPPVPAPAPARSPEKPSLDAGYGYNPVPLPPVSGYGYNK